MIETLSPTCACLLVYHFVRVLDMIFRLYGKNEMRIAALRQPVLTVECRSPIR